MFYQMMWTRPEKEKPGRAWNLAECVGGTGKQGLRPARAGREERA